MERIINFILGSETIQSIGVIVLLAVLTRILSSERRQKIGIRIAMFFAVTLKGFGKTMEVFGRTVTGFGSVRIGRKSWNKLEDFFQKTVGEIYLSGIAYWREQFKVNPIEYIFSCFSKGLNYDDNGGEGNEKGQ